MFPTKQSVDKAVVSILYWHSLIITSITPFVRLMYGRWFVVTPWKLYPTYPTPMQHPTGDRAMGYHAVLALLWITAAYINVVHIKIGTVYHKIFGYITFMIFLFHAIAGYHLVYQDIEQHSYLNICILLYSMTRTTKLMLRAINAARRGNIEEHQTLMVHTFIASLDGAGTIRTVGFVQTLFGVGPV